MIDLNPSSFSVLFIEDNLSYANILRRRLLQESNPSFRIDHVDELRPGLERLNNGKTDVVLLDLTLPDSKGLDTLIQVRRHAPEVPVVVSTALDDTIGVEALRQGADDYIVKGQLSGKEISRALRYAIERHRLRSELKDLSLKDELTGLYNRRGFSTLAEQQIKLALRTKTGFLLFFMDIDDFKEINNVYGHLKGDQVLADFGNVLKSTFRSSDIVTRIGGDEFVVLVPKPFDNTPDILISRLRKNLERRRSKSDHPSKLSVSTGVEAFDPYDPCTVEELLSRADKYMYKDKAKKHDRGTYGTD